MQAGHKRENLCFTFVKALSTFETQVASVPLPRTEEAVEKSSLSSAWPALANLFTASCTAAARTMTYGL